MTKNKANLSIIDGFYIAGCVFAIGFFTAHSMHPVRLIITSLAGFGTMLFVSKLTDNILGHGRSNSRVIGSYFLSVGTPFIGLYVVGAITGDLLAGGTWFFGAFTAALLSKLLIPSTQSSPRNKK